MLIVNDEFVKLLSPMFHFDRSQNPINVIDAPIMRGCDRQLNSIKRFFYGWLTVKRLWDEFYRVVQKSGSDHIFV